MIAVRHRLLILCLMLFLLIPTFWGCKQNTGSNTEIYDIEPITLNDGEKAHALTMARAYLTGQNLPAKSADTEKLYEHSPRGVFVSVARPDGPALTGFAMADSIADGIRKAADDLKSQTKGKSLDKYRVRVDIIRASTGRLTQKLNDRWKKLDISRNGAIFETVPPVAVLPQEMRDRGVLDHKGKFNAKRMRKLLRHRGVSSEQRAAILSNDTVNFARAKMISFMEGDNGKLVNLLRMNRAEGFEPTIENLRKSIDAAGKYLAAAVREDGTFEYHYHPQINHVSSDYNELRHAGTTFAMMQIYEVNKDPEVLKAAERALGWLERYTKGPGDGDQEKYDWNALNDKRFRYAKLGGSGLSLLAFGWHGLVTGDDKYHNLMNGYAKFVDYMVQNNGDVVMRYWNHAKDKGRSSTPVLYYPGEAFFGLSTLYKLDKNPRWIDVASKGIDYIVDVRDKNKPDRSLPHDHWMAYAINHIYMVKPKESHVKHAWRLFNAMDSVFHRDHKDPDMVGGYFKRPVSVRVGCRLEATTAFYRLAEQIGDEKRMEQFLDVLKKGTSFLMRTQYDEYNTMFFEDPIKPRGAMMRSYWEPSTQIDYTQHSISSIIETYNILRERAGKAEKPITQKIPTEQEKQELKPAA